jgi:hypothetical protein
VRKVFISYARLNRPDIDQLVEHLRVLGCDTWVDTSLHGGQDWWEEILRRIADCDTFIPIISHEALNSTACKREFDWADALNKPVLPVAIQPPPKALPGRFVRRQIIDYSSPADRDRAALTLAGGLATLPPAPELPVPLPEAPPAPLSYLTDIIDLVSQREPLDHAQQRDLVNQLEPALHSVDPEERRGGRDILELLSSRDDLYADVYRTLDRLKDVGDQPELVDHLEPSRDSGAERTGTSDQAASHTAAAAPPHGSRDAAAKQATPITNSELTGRAPISRADQAGDSSQSAGPSKPQAKSARSAGGGSRAVAWFATVAAVGLILLIVSFFAGVAVFRSGGLLLMLIGGVGGFVSVARSKHKW